MAASTLVSIVTLRSGEKHELTHNVQGTGGRITHKKLRESLQTIQGEINEFLTVQVELEKGLNRQSNSRTDDSQDEELNDDDEEDEANDQKEKGQGDNNEEQTNQEPPTKKPKK